MSGKASLPMEICDKIVKECCTPKALPRGLPRTRTRTRTYEYDFRECGSLRRVNKAFYYSATRLMFQTFVIQLDRGVHRGHFPFIKFEELCCNANARYIETLVIKCVDNLSKAAAARNLGLFAGTCKRFALDLEQFASLRSVELVFYRNPYGSDDMIAGDQIEQIVDALRLAQLPKLERLSIFYDGQAEGRYKDDECPPENPRSTHPPIVTGIENLRSVTLRLGFSRVSRKLDVSMTQILEHGKNLESVDGYGIYRWPRCSSAFIHPSAPLRSLHLKLTFIPGKFLLDLQHFRNTLTDIRFENVQLSSRSWAEFFIILQQFSVLRRLKVWKCGYCERFKWYTCMGDADQRALLQYRAHCTRTREETSLQPHLQSVSIDVSECWFDFLTIKE